jgi:hypothetical protein
MKKLYLISALLLAGVALMLFTGCDDTTGDAPTNVVLTAASDVTVKIAWTASTTTPDKYIIYFKTANQATYADVGNVTGTSYTHDPSGACGTYYIAAKYGSTEYNSDTKSTIPVASTSITLSELNATGSSGYGWGRTAFGGQIYSMGSASNASSVDFYLTNFAAGFGATPYNIASPDQGPTDPGGVVPVGGWRVNAISNAISDPQAALPAHSNTTYFNFTALSAYPCYLGVYTSDGYYALIKVDGLNTTNGTVTVESWFQSLKGLRLIQH